MDRQHDTKEWLRAVARYMNLSLSDLARNSSLAASTVTRFVNDRSNKLTITEKTLDAISAYSGVAKNVMPGQKRLPGFSESEAVPYDPITEGEKLPDWANAAVEAMKLKGNGIEPWIMKGWALDLLGILPGDLLFIDRNKRPKAGDIVIARLTDLATSRAETVIRRFDPPFVTTHSAKLGPSRPEQVDDDRVTILGVELGMIRPHS